VETSSSLGFADPLDNLTFFSTCISATSFSIALLAASESEPVFFTGCTGEEDVVASVVLAMFLSMESETVAVLVGIVVLEVTEGALAGDLAKNDVMGRAAGAGILSSIATELGWRTLITQPELRKCRTHGQELSIFLAELVSQTIPQP